MCDAALTMKNRSNGKNGKAVVQGKAERSENRQKSQRKSSVFHSISLIVLHVLDAMLLVILLPFMIWQWVSANDRLKIILKAVVEVAVELIMWVIFAGVSILMTTTFVLEEVYFRKNDNEKLRQLMIARNELTPNDNESQKEYPPHSKEQEKLKTENKDRPLC